MAACLQLYKKSTFPPLLDNYLPVHQRNQNSENQQKIETGKKKQMRNKQQALSHEEKDEIIRQALKERHHLETFDNLYKLRNVLCEQYRTLLNEKVQKQRIQIKMSNFRVQQHIEHKEKKIWIHNGKEHYYILSADQLRPYPGLNTCTRKGNQSYEAEEDAVTLKYIPSHKVPFGKLSHDAKYLETIPQSSSYLIIGLQNELTKLGILKNQEDYENFWKLAKEGVHESKLKEMLPDIKAKMFAIKPSPLSSSARIDLVKHHNGFTSINRLNNSMAASLQQSASTCQLLAHHMNKQMTTQTPTKEMFPKWGEKLTSSRKRTKFESSGIFKTNKILFKLLHSWLSEVQKKHGEQPSRTQQVSQAFKRNKRYEKHLHYLYHMHYFSLINMASSKRLLEKNGQFSDAKTGQSIHDLMEYLFPNWHEQSGMNHNIKIMEENTFPSSVGRKQQEMYPKGFSMFSSSKEKRRMLKQYNNKDVGERVEDQKCNFTTCAQQEVITVPLTLEDTALCHPVMEVKPTGTYWKNYVDYDLIINSEKHINCK